MSKNLMTLSQLFNHAFLAPKGYDGFRNMQSHDGQGVYDSYIRHSKCIASGITQHNFQVSFLANLIPLLSTLLLVLDFIESWCIRNIPDFKTKM